MCAAPVASGHSQPILAEELSIRRDVRIMNIYSEMMHYITTGRCPYCDTVILDAKFLRRNKIQLDYYARFLSSASFRAQFKDRYPYLKSPPGAKVSESWGSGQMLCLTCMKEWPTGASARKQAEPDVIPQQIGGLSRLGQQGPPYDSKTSPVTELNLAGCSVTELKTMGSIETPLPQEVKTYPNNSKVATVTKEVSITNTITREVTIESSQLRARNAEAGITLFGFATIQGQIQEQLNQSYAVTTRNTISISEKTTIEIPPGTTIEHVIRWAVVSEKGLAILGKSEAMPAVSRLAEIPYQIPLRLTYTEEVRDTSGTPR